VGTSRAGAATAALVVASVLWGTTGTAASLLPADVSPLATGASTMAVGGALLFALAARPSLSALADPTARRWLLVGSVGVVVYPLAFYSAMDQAGVAIGNVVALGSGPVFAALFEWLWERRGLSRRWFVSTGIAVVGIALLSTGRHADAAADGQVGAGVLLGLVAGLAYALYSYASTRAIGAGHGARGVMGGMFGLGAIPLFGVLAAVGAPLLQSTASVSVAAYLAVGPMLLAYLLFGFGLTHHRSSVATSVTLVEPVVATLLAVVIVGERLAPIGWIGLAAILAGVTVLIAARQPPPTAATF
jgi:DME family drug/metabolite transporter